jgi:hypothetical protein
VPKKLKSHVSNEKALKGISKNIEETIRSNRTWDILR